MKLSGVGWEMGRGVPQEAVHAASIGQRINILLSTIKGRPGKPCVCDNVNKVQVCANYLSINFFINSYLQRYWKRDLNDRPRNLTSQDSRNVHPWYSIDIKINEKLFVILFLLS